jgi:hypothetical protein
VSVLKNQQLGSIGNQTIDMQVVRLLDFQSWAKIDANCKL